MQLFASEIEKRQSHAVTVSDSKYTLPGRVAHRWKALAASKPLLPVAREWEQHWARRSPFPVASTSACSATVSQRCCGATWSCRIPFESSRREQCDGAGGEALRDTRSRTEWRTDRAMHTRSSCVRLPPRSATPHTGGECEGVSHQLRLCLLVRRAYRTIRLIFRREAALPPAARSLWLPTPLPNSTSSIRIWCDLDAQGQGHGSGEVMTLNFDPVFRALAQLRTWPNSVAWRACTPSTPIR
jgi:hypothetical protein